MMNRIKIIVLLTLMVLICIPVPVFAEGDGNIDSGGSGMGQGTSNNVWSPGAEGVRVTVVRSSDHAVITTPIDLTNVPPSSSIYNFGKVSKIQYNGGRSMSPVQGGYTCVKPSIAMPLIISTTGNNNIDEIKRYFCSEYLVQLIGNHTGMNYDILINGDYKLLLEPIAYYKFEGVMIATTATEAAMYDEIVNGLLRIRMVSLTHKNLPLAMFLEVSDLGYPAWSGSITTSASDSDIKSSLGLGIVRFTEILEEVVVSAYDYEYRVDTDVITAVTVSGGQSDPDNPTQVSFKIAGTTYTVSNIYYPAGDSQLVWVKWHTPSSEQTMDIHVSVSGSGNSNKSTIHVNIVDLDQNPPPNPVADDRNDDFEFVSVPDRVEDTSAEWSIWRPWWKAHWVDEGYWSSYSWTDSLGHSYSSSYWVSRWVDRGWWEFDFIKYQATLTSSMEITCDSTNPTAHGRIMKSGYGINESVIATISTNQSTAVTYPQNAVSYFPEFQYQTYWRLLERIQSGSTAKFVFQKNVYSTYKNRTHFTPIWMPDGTYKVNTWLIDAWTPAGMLSMNLSDSLIIEGNLWSDWHISPLDPKR